MPVIGVILVLVLSFNATTTNQPAEVAVSSEMDSPRLPDVPLPTDGTWTLFSWDSGPGVFNNEGAFLFTSTVGGRLDVTDAYIVGDRFDVYDLGAFVGQTSVPVDDGSNIGGDAEAAYYNPDCSSGSFLLSAGSHEVTIWISQVATGYPSGGAYLRFTEGLLFADRFESGLLDHWSAVATAQ
jgi:hypothetical protein